MIEIVIPGKPHAQGRPRAARIGKRVRMYDPPASVEWKRAAAVLMRVARGREALLCGPVSVEIAAVFASQKGGFKGRATRGWYVARPDGDNIAKAVLDAGTGVLWVDDAQVVDLRVHKLAAEPGESAHVRVTVAPAGAAQGG